MKAKYIIPISLIFGILLMITDELMIRFADGHPNYDVPILGYINSWIAWQAVFAMMAFLFGTMAVMAGDEWKTK